MKKNMVLAGLVAAAMVFAAGSIVFAQTSFLLTTANTGLVSLMPDHVAILSLADVSGEDRAVGFAVLEILGAEDNVLKEIRGVFRPGEPLFLRLDREEVISREERLPIRARARVLTFPSSGRPLPDPMLTVELLNKNTFDSFQATVCPVPSENPGDRGPVFNCGPCSIDFSP